MLSRWRGRCALPRWRSLPRSRGGDLLSLCAGLRRRGGGLRGGLRRRGGGLRGRPLHFLLQFLIGLRRGRRRHHRLLVLARLALQQGECAELQHVAGAGDADSDA